MEIERASDERETAPAMQSITAELRRMVNIAGSYTAYANYMNETVQPLLLLLTTLLPDQAKRLAQAMQLDRELAVMLTQLDMQFGIVSGKLAQANGAIPSLSIDPPQFQTVERTTTIGDRRLRR